MNPPLVSVVVPVFNAEQFLGAALESVLGQDYQPTEVIVVDDGSTDGSGAIARSFPNVRYLHQENAGPVVARAAGVRAAGGDLIAFHDADDVMMRDKVSTQVAYLLAHPEVGCVLARHELLREPGTGTDDWLPRDLVFGDPGGVEAQAALVRRETLEQVSFESTNDFAGGVDWLGRIRDAGYQIGVVDRPLWYRRIHATNMSRDRDLIQRHLLRAVRARVDRARPRRGDAPPR